MVLLSMPIMIYGLNVARSIIEEKTSRIFEVMLAMAKPGDMLAGKLIGVGAVGLTQIAIWVVAAAVFMGTRAGGARCSPGDIAIHFSWAEGILFPVYFVLGFSLYSAIFSAWPPPARPRRNCRMYHVAGIVPLYTSIRHSSGHDQRSQLRLEHCRIAFPAHCALSS